MPVLFNRQHWLNLFSFLTSLVQIGDMEMQMNESQSPSYKPWRSGSSDLLFRPAVANESPQIAKLVNSAYRGDSSRKGWTTEADLLDGQRTDAEAIRSIILQPKNWILLCLKNSEIVGSVHLEKKDSQTCYFGMFTVNPQLQTGGIGKSFINESEKFASQELGCRWMEMTVITLRKELIAWYERRGYHATGELRDFPYNDERFGIPRRDDIVLGVWKKKLIKD